MGRPKKEKLPKDWDLFIKYVEKTLKSHAREIAVEAVKALYFGKIFYSPKKK